MVIFHLIFLFSFHYNYWNMPKEVLKHMVPFCPTMSLLPISLFKYYFFPLTPQALLSLLLTLQRHGLSYMEYRILHRQHPLTPKWKRKSRPKFPAYFSYSPSYRRLSQISNFIWKISISSLTSASKWINCDVLSTEDKILLTYTERQ